MEYSSFTKKEIFENIIEIGKLTNLEPTVKVMNVLKEFNLI